MYYLDLLLAAFHNLVESLGRGLLDVLGAVLYQASDQDLDKCCQEIYESFKNLNSSNTGVRTSKYHSNSLYICSYTDLDVALHHLLLLGVPGLHHGVAGGVLGGEELVGAGRHVGHHGSLVRRGALLHVVLHGVLEALVALSLPENQDKTTVFL